MKKKEKSDCLFKETKEVQKETDDRIDDNQT